MKTSSKYVQATTTISTSTSPIPNDNDYHDYQNTHHHHNHHPHHHHINHTTSTTGGGGEPNRNYTTTGTHPRRSTSHNHLTTSSTNKSDELPLLMTKHGILTNSKSTLNRDDEIQVVAHHHKDQRCYTPVEKNANYEMEAEDRREGGRRVEAIELVAVRPCSKDGQKSNRSKTHHHHHHHKYNSEQNILLANQSFSSLTKLDGSLRGSGILSTSGSPQYLPHTHLHHPHLHHHHSAHQQHSLERPKKKHPPPLRKQHSYTCEQNQRVLQRLERDAVAAASGRRMKSPSPLLSSGDTGAAASGGGGHRGSVSASVCAGYEGDGVLMGTYSGGSGGGSVTGGGRPGSAAGGYDKELLKCDEYGFRRGHSFKRSSDRANGASGGQSKRRAAGDGMAAVSQMQDDTELIFELPEQLNSDCPPPPPPCGYDHVIYAGHGFSSLHDDHRFPPAPDVTRRLGTPLGSSSGDGITISNSGGGGSGKVSGPNVTMKGDTPPYYRASSVTSSSSQSSRVDLSTKHWYLIVIILLLAAAAGVGVPIALKISAGASLEERLEFASRLLGEEVPLVDGHNDLPWNIRKFLHNRLREFRFDGDLRQVAPWSTSAWSHTDLVRLKRGHVSAQFWAAYVPCDSQYKDAVQLTLEQIDVIRRLTDLYQPSLTLCTSSMDIKNAFKKSQMCSLIGVEGGHSLAGSLAVLRTLYHVGVRYLTLTSTCNTPWADCSHADLPGKKPEHGGLTNFGKSVVKEMNRLGMIVDLSHVSVRTMRDALAVSKAPVIFSHSSAHALCNSTRNVPDATLRKLAMNRGLVMVNFYSLFLTCNEVSTVADAVAHINHIREIAGVDNVGLGAGYDGINFVPTGLEDVSSYPTLFAELIGTGKWTVEDLKKLAGLNFLRVFDEVERVRDEFQKAKVPPYEDVLMPKPRINNCSSQDTG